ncbi:MAG TPA: hypothetical protein VGH37_06630 [Candidatus Acidoferrum sp.]
MGFEIFVQCVGKSERLGIPRAAIRSLFPIIEKESEPDYWSIRYDDKNSCYIGVTPATSDNQFLSGLYVDRPCGDLRLWEGLLSIFRMGSVVIFCPGGSPVVAEQTVAGDLPQDMINSIGQPRLVGSVEEDLVRLVRES